MRTAAPTTDEESAVRLTLSPSRASDFMTCPLLYRFRTIDRLPERPSPEATRGTVVHAVLERLFDLPAAVRDTEAGKTLATPCVPLVWALQRQLVRIEAEGLPSRQLRLHAIAPQTY